MIVHPIEPIFDADSKVLILGSFPSVKSREKGFFYGHVQNRFWKVLAGVFDDRVPIDIEQKKELLIKNKIALWDVIKSCEIEGSSDSSIKNVVVNDFDLIFQTADIKKIYVNGKMANKLYEKHLKENIGKNAVCLPSTSPANAAWNLERLISAWKQIREV